MRRMSGFKTEADSPLLVDANTPLTVSIAAAFKELPRILA